jgi:hypothetical protein
VDAITGIITTVAGNGLNGYTGDGGVATSAKMNFPKDIWLDSNGTMFIADTGNNILRRVDATTGIITTIAGTGFPGYSGDGGLAINAKLGMPTAIAGDSNGNVFVVDASYRVRCIDANGIITTVAGNGNYTFSGDGPATNNTIQAYGLGVDPNGTVYIADSSNHRIRVLVTPPQTTTGQITTGQVSTGRATTVQLTTGPTTTAGQATTRQVTTASTTMGQLTTDQTATGTSTSVVVNSGTRNLANAFGVIFLVLSFL